MTWTACAKCRVTSPTPKYSKKHWVCRSRGVPNPFDSDYESYAAHNNAKLREFLDGFGFDYEFMSSSEDCYKNGRFDDTLRLMLEKYEEVRGAVLPILGEERAATYSPLFPVVQKKNTDQPHPIILHNTILKEVTDLQNGVATFIVQDDSEKERSGYGEGEEITQSVYKGVCKAQWRADWALRWYALDVDYENGGQRPRDLRRYRRRHRQNSGRTRPRRLPLRAFP